MRQLGVLVMLACVPFSCVLVVVVDLSTDVGLLLSMSRLEVFTGYNDVILHEIRESARPQSNSQAEIFNKDMADYICKMLIEADAKSTDWEQFIMPLMFSYNTTLHSSLGMMMSSSMSSVSVRGHSGARAG